MMFPLRFAFILSDEDSGFNNRIVLLTASATKSDRSKTLLSAWGSEGK
jgi:hypothetical protein